MIVTYCLRGLGFGKVDSLYTLNHNRRKVYYGHYCTADKHLEAVSTINSPCYTNLHGRMQWS